MTALVLPARSARNVVGIRPKTSSRIVVRCSPCRAALSWSAGVSLTSWWKCCGSTDDRSAGSNSGMGFPSDRAGAYSRVTLRTGRYARKVPRVPRSIRVEQMLDAAVAVFSQRGYHAASMDDIAERAGISKPMVYAYLGAKEDVFLACVQREATRLMEGIAGVIDPALPPDEQLWAGLRAYFTFVGEHRDGWSVLYRQARVQEPFAGELAEIRGRMIEAVTALLGGVLNAEGPEVPAAEVSAMAHALVGAGESLADWLVDHPDESPEATAARLMNFIWMGA